MENQSRERICPAGSDYYTWQQGDTLTGIAQRFGLTAQAIRQANAGLPLETVSPGTRVCLPQRPASCPSGRLYTVRRGDTLVSIARTQGVSTAQLMEQNPYVEPDRLEIGQVLCLPDEPTPQPPQPPQPSRPQPTPGGCPAGYSQDTVRYGESLVGVLTRYNMSYSAFTSANPRINAAALVPGQRYCVPPSGQRGSCGGGRSHQIPRGGSLSAVAREQNTTPIRLLTLNPNLAPGDFVPGRVICVPR